MPPFGGCGLRYWLLTALGSGPRARFFDSSEKPASLAAQSASFSGGSDFVLGRSDSSDRSSGNDFVAVAGREFEELGRS